MRAIITVMNATEAVAKKNSGMGTLMQYCYSSVYNCDDRPVVHLSNRPGTSIGDFHILYSYSCI